jgi:hypothetical protein
VEKPKAREVYAAQYEDRVVHHWLAPQLEAAIDRDFIHDAASNRRGKGTHFAVDRVQSFMRRMAGRGYFLQLDIANFFNSIHHPTLLELLSRKLQKAVKRRRMPLAQARQCYRIAQRIVRQPLVREAIHLCSADAYRCVPPHKRLANAPSDTGLPIGNLTSQFFANLYLDELDQFVKHELKCRYYVRYVDDSILLHPDRAQLAHWHQAIAAFLQERLRLQLKPDFTLAPLNQGANFLGYIIRPGYRLVRRRVVGNLHDRLARHAGHLLRRVRGGLWLDLHPATRAALRVTLASYWGHFHHASSHRLKHRIFQRFPWLGELFEDPISLCPRWQPPAVTSLASQWRYFLNQFPGCRLIVQCGRQLLLSAAWPGAAPYLGAARITAWSVPIGALPALRRYAQRGASSYLFVSEQGYLKGGLKRRIVREIWLNASDARTLTESLFPPHGEDR